MCPAQWKHSLILVCSKRFCAKKGSWASEATGRWSSPAGSCSAWRTNVRPGGTATGHAASGRTRSPGVSAGAALATMPGTKARPWRSWRSPFAPRWVFTLISLPVYSTSTPWKRWRREREEQEEKRWNFSTRLRVPSHRKWSQVSGWEHSPIV